MKAIEARLLLGALFFLVLASYLAVPCMNRDASQFQDVGAPNSCSEHQIFKPQADLSRLLRALAPEPPFRLPVALAGASAPFLAALLMPPAAHDAMRRRRLRRGTRLPFATADPPRFTPFMALRDA